jgi:hypothetical protein
MVFCNQDCVYKPHFRLGHVPFTLYLSHASGFKDSNIYVQEVKIMQILRSLGTSDRCLNLIVKK